jgi:hypothetical protein
VSEEQVIEYDTDMIFSTDDNTNFTGNNIINNNIQNTLEQFDNVNRNSNKYILKCVLF